MMMMGLCHFPCKNKDTVHGYCLSTSGCVNPQYQYECYNVIKRVAHWQPAPKKDPLSFKGCYSVCSNCGEEVFFGWEKNYCPNCGFYMQGDTYAR